jgi:hypothetical protein
MDGSRVSMLGLEVSRITLQRALVDPLVAFSRCLEI